MHLTVQRQPYFTKARTWKLRCPFIEEQMKDVVYSIQWNTTQLQLSRLASVKPHFQVLSPWRPELQHMNWVGDTNIQSGADREVVFSFFPSCPHQAVASLRLCEGVRSHELQGEKFQMLLKNVWNSLAPLPISAIITIFR